MASHEVLSGAWATGGVACVFQNMSCGSDHTDEAPSSAREPLSSVTSLSLRHTHVCHVHTASVQCEQELSPALAFGGESRPVGALKLSRWENGAACPSCGKMGILK